MLSELRDRIASFLARHRVCVLSVNGSPGAWAMPVRYHLLPEPGGDALVVECLLPHWADGLFYLEQNPHVMLVIRETDVKSLCWLQIQGQGHPIAQPDWQQWPLPNHAVPPEALYRVVRVMPRRIDLVDESRGWGARETLELDADR